MLHLIFTWLMFEAGQAINIWAKLNQIVRDKTNPASSRMELFILRLDIFAWRVFAASCFFGVFLSGLGPTILTSLHVEPPLWLDTLSAVMNTLAAPFLAGMFGLGMDAILSKFPGLSSYFLKDN